jgi:peptide/nickel transport system permease protein
MRKFLSDIASQRSGLIAFGFIVALALAGMLVGFVPGLDPHTLSNDALLPPSAQYLMGTDDLGRSVLAGVLYGIRISLTVGFFAAVVATFLGILIGAVSGFYGGRLDTFIMRVAEFFQVVPSFILAAVIVAMSGPGLPQIVLIVGLLSWPQVARVMRGEVMRVKQLEFVDAVRCMGIAEHKVLFGEVIPNAVSPVLAVGTLIVGQAILLEAALSFLGLTSAELVSWGRMLNSGQRMLFNAWWLSFFPGIAIFLTVLAFNVFGDAVGAVFNPRNRR